MFAQGCKFNGPSDKTLLCDNECLTWELVSCESNVDALENDNENQALIRFCDSGKGVIFQDDQQFVIKWKMAEVLGKKNLCWTDATDFNYCYDLELLSKNKLVLLKDNKKEDGYKKRVVCTYKPLEKGSY